MYGIDPSDIRRRTCGDAFRLPGRGPDRLRILTIRTMDMALPFRFGIPVSRPR